jgi:hypothetical protein
LGFVIFRSKGFVSSMEDFVKIGPEQKAKIQELYRLVTAKCSAPEDYPPCIAPSVDEQTKDIVMYKFLVARKWDIRAAEKMFTVTQEFRKSRQLDTVPIFPSFIPARGYGLEELIEFRGKGLRIKGECDKQYEAVSACYNCAWHKYDKDGRPIWYELTSRTNVKGLVQVCKALTPPGKDHSKIILDLHTASNEIGGLLVQHMDAKHRAQGKPRVIDVMVVLDCKDLGFGHLYNPCLELLKVAAQCDAEYYPEGLARLYVVNCPGMISFAWNVVKRWFDPRVQQKIKFFKPEQTTAALLEVIDAHSLPAFLGGKCNCEGHCVPPPTGAAADQGDETQTEEIVLKAGKTTMKEMTVVSSETVTWSWHVPDKNVVFSATWQPKKGGSSMEVYPATKGNNHEGNYTAGEEGTMTLVWDNTYSWMNSKTIQMRVLKN